MTVVTDAHLCGWRVHSEISLPELLPWSGEARDPDVNIRLGEVHELTDARSIGPRIQLSADRRACRIAISRVATFLISDGQNVVVQTETKVEPIILRNYLFGSVLGVLCHQRSLFPLHGSCILMGSGAIAFSGKSGAGKSTLVAALARRGHTLLCDDVCAIEISDSGPLVRPAFPRVKLHPSSLHAVGLLNQEAMIPGVCDNEKLHFRFEPYRHFTPQTIPLRTIYFLRTAANQEEEGIRELHGVDAIGRLESQIFRRKLGVGMDRTPSLFLDASRIASAVRLCTLTRSFDLSRLEETIEMLEALHPDQQNMMQTPHAPLCIETL